MSIQVANVKGEIFSVEVRLVGINDACADLNSNASLFDLIVRPAIVAGKDLFHDFLPDMPNVNLHVSTPNASLFLGDASELKWGASELSSYLQEAAERMVKELDELEKA
ncbi:hypothetical protein D3C86_823980 [compost metagenome]